MLSQLACDKLVSWTGKNSTYSIPIIVKVEFITFDTLHCPDDILKQRTQYKTKCFCNLAICRPYPIIKDKLLPH